MAIYLLISEDGYAEQTDLKPKIEPLSWPKVVRIDYKSEAGEYTVDTPAEGGWCDLPEHK
jgi:hypothetical protein